MNSLAQILKPLDPAGSLPLYQQLQRAIREAIETRVLGPDDALVMEGTMPDCDFANLVLWNPHMQTIDYRSRRSSLNNVQMELGPGGSFRIVISQQDPGVPNWLDTGGHRRGTMFWRFLLPKEDPETPRCRVVPVSEVATG